MSSIHKITAKQEALAQLIVQGKGIAEAYAEAYDVSKMTMNTLRVKASEAAAVPVVAARMQELREAAAKATVMTLAVDLNDLLLLRNRAAQQGQLGVAVAAEIARAKAAGLYSEKLSVEHSLKKELPASCIDDFL